MAVFLDHNKRLATRRNEVEPMIAEVVISDYWTERIEILFTLGCGLALGFMLRMAWERDK